MVFIFFFSPFKFDGAAHWLSIHLLWVFEFDPVKNDSEMAKEEVLSHSLAHDGAVKKHPCSGIFMCKVHCRQVRLGRFSEAEEL